MRLGATLAACMMAASTSQAAVTNDCNRILRGIEERFSPSKPTAHLTYRVTYKLLGIELKHVANAKLLATEGSWRGENGSNSPACLVDIRIDTRDEWEPAVKRQRLSLHNRAVAVVAMPSLEAVVFGKRTRQSFRILWHRRLQDHVERYDLQSGGLDYYKHDFAAGTSTTNMAGRAEMEAQGRNICRLLRLVSDAHAGIRREPAQVYLFIEGLLIPRTVHFVERNVPVRAMGLKLQALHARVVRGSDRRDSYEGEGYVVSFLDIAEAMGREDLAALARSTPQWSMVPVRAEIGLSVGGLQGELSSVSADPYRAAGTD